jgi:hypothetical protein
MFDVDVQVTVADGFGTDEAETLVRLVECRGHEQEIRQAVTAVLAKLTDRYVQVRVNVAAKEVGDGRGQPDRTL